MNPLVFLGAIIVFQIAQAIFLAIGKKDIKHLWVSFFLICVPFVIERVLVDNGGLIMTGTLGSIYKITVPMVAAVPLFILARTTQVFRVQWIDWVTFVFLLIIISVFNPFNVDTKASIAWGIIFASNILFFKILSTYIDGVQLIKGIYNGFFILCVMQFLLAICFPVLNMISVTTLFHANGDIEATRSGTRVGAIGLFPHPGNLALFILMSSSFFLSCALYRFKSGLSWFTIFLNIITIVLTFSRTSILGLAIVFGALIFIKNNAHKNIFTFGNLIKFVLPITLVLGWLIFLSPFSDVFLKSDAEEQYANRKIFYQIGYHIFKASPIIGVGLNSELAYVARNPDVISSVTTSGPLSDFYRANPIHNIHILILAETGLVGALLWLFFIFRNFSLSLLQLKKGFNQIISLSFIGILISVCFYGTTGWSPLSPSIFPFFLFIAYFGIKCRV